DTSADQQSLASEGSYTVGIDGALAAILGAPRDLFRSDTTSHVWSFCHAGDPICQGDPAKAFITNFGLYKFAHHNDYNVWGEPELAADAFKKLEIKGGGLPAPLLGYELDRSTDGGATWINDYQGYAGNATIGNTDCGSTPGATCKYRLHADNWLGTGPASNTLSITNPTLPGAPTLTAISGDSYGTVRLTWTVACPAYLIIDSRGSGDPLGTISRPGGAFLAEFLRIHPGYGWALDAPTAGIEVDTNGGPRAAGQYEAVGLPKSVGDAVVFPAKYYLSVR